MAMFVSLLNLPITERCRVYILKLVTVPSSLFIYPPPFPQSIHTNFFEVMPSPDSEDISPKKTIRFADVDEYIEVCKYDDEEPTTPSKSVNVMRWTPSPSASSEDSFPTPDISDQPVLHVAIRPDGMFYWDMAESPETLEILESCGDDSAAVWRVDRAPLTAFQLTVDGIYKWAIDVKAEQRGFPSLRDTLTTIFKNTSKPASRSDVESLPPYTKSQVLKARETRCLDFSLDPRGEPLRRVDFMLSSRRFLGITTSSETRIFTMNIGIHDPRN